MRLCFTCLLVLLVHPFDLRAAETPEAILQHMRSVYGGLTSYSDTGTVIREYTASSRDEFRFSTRFQRGPRHFFFDYRKPMDRLVVWADPDAFHVWWKATGQATDYPNPNNTAALGTSDYPTSGAISKIVPLLYSKANLPGTIVQFQPSKIAGMEDVGGAKCYRLEGIASDTYGQTGRAVNERKVAVWIDSTTYLVRKVVEQPPPAPGTLDRTTITFDPQANPRLDDSSFRFAPPK